MIQKYNLGNFKFMHWLYYLLEEINFNLIQLKCVDLLNLINFIFLLCEFF
jgi:hypothetical protein